MDLTAALLRLAASRPRVLLATMPGATRVRLAAERELRLRDLPAALTPAEADILLVAGPICSALEAAADRLWQDVPAPRSRAHAETVEQVAAVIEASCRHLADLAAQREDGSHGGHGHPTGMAMGGGIGIGESMGMGMGMGESMSMAHGHHSRMAMSGDMHMDMGHMDMGGMGTPFGLPMAHQGPDRDGLALDRLHVPLGPFLPDWPTGLTVRLTLQGDVIQQALVEPAPHGEADGVPFWTEPWERAAEGERICTGEAARRRAGAHLDSLGRFLAVAGWPAAATAARRLRDDLLAGAAGAMVRPRAERLVRRVGRSRTLFWLTSGMGSLSATDARAAGVSGPAARADGDVPARYRQWLDAVLDDLARLDDPSPLSLVEQEGPHGRLGGSRPSSVALLALLPSLLEGTELAAARLIVASLDPDPDELAALPAEAARD